MHQGASTVLYRHDFRLKYFIYVPKREYDCLVPDIWRSYVNGVITNLYHNEINGELLQGLRSLLLVVRARDAYTFSHCVRVGHMSMLLAQAAGLNPQEQAVAECAGLLHDIGKVVIPEHVLQKPARLTDEEMKLMQNHSQHSADMLAPFMTHTFFHKVMPAVLHHHERIDGLGYPFGLSGDAIPLVARVIAVADTFDAMTADRPYRRGLPEDRVFRELRDFSGRQFDKELVKTFLQAYRFWKKRPGVRPAAHDPMSAGPLLYRPIRPAA